MKNNKWILLVVLSLVASLMLAACASEEPADDGTGDDTTTETDGGDGEDMDDDMDDGLSGDVVADGSSTVYPVTTAVAEEFQDEYPDVDVSVGLSGTGGGFEKFCPGETDIQNASRPVKDSEADICAENGISFTEFIVALDGLSVVVSPENDFVDCLTTDDLLTLFRADSDVTTWSDLDESYPDEEILFFVPDPDSGTRDYFVEAILEDAMGDEADVRQDDNTTNSSDDNTLLQGIGGNEFAIGFFGFAYYVNNQDAVNIVEIENPETGECVAPNNDTVQSGTYAPLSRPLFVYTNNDSIRDKPQVAEFMQFYFSEDGAPAIMADVGYSLPPEGTFETNLDLIEQILAGENPEGGMEEGGDEDMAEEEDGDMDEEDDDMAMEWGTEENPIVIAFVPSGDAAEIIDSGTALTDRLSEITGLVIESQVPTNYAGAIEALCAGEAQAAALNTFSYVIAADRDCAEAGLVSVRFGASTYNGQFITRADSGIESLEDIEGATFCRPDPFSTSGWIAPSIALAEAGITEDDLAEIVDADGHTGVVRQVYEGNCDVGATFVDARGNLEEEAPDVLEQVVVIDTTLDIPNDNIAYADELPEDIREQINTAMIEMFDNEDDLEIINSVYSWDSLEPIEDSFYDNFRQVLEAAGVDAGDFLEE